MSKIDLFNVLAVLFSAATYVIYIIPILRKSEPTAISTWIAWLLIDLAVLAPMILAGKISWAIVTYAAGCTSILLACLWVKMPLQWKVIDTVCILLVVLAMSA